MFCALLPRWCSPVDGGRIDEIAKAGRDVSRAALRNVVQAKRVENSGDVLGSITHSMRNALTAKHLMESGEPPNNGNV